MKRTLVRIDKAAERYLILSALAVLAGIILAFCIKMNWLDWPAQILGKIFGW